MAEYTGRNRTAGYGRPLGVAVRADGTCSTVPFYGQPGPGDWLRGAYDRMRDVLGKFPGVYFMGKNHGVVHPVPTNIGWSAFALEKGTPGRVEGHHLSAKLLVDVFEGGERTVRYAFRRGIGYVDDVVRERNVGHKMTRRELREFNRLLSTAVPV